MIIQYTHYRFCQNVICKWSRSLQCRCNIIQNYYGKLNRVSKRAARLLAARLLEVSLLPVIMHLIIILHAIIVKWYREMLEWNNEWPKATGWLNHSLKMSMSGQVDEGCIGCGLCIQPLQRRKEGEKQMHWWTSNRHLCLLTSKYQKCK